MRPIQVALFASGRGSNAVALIEKAKALSGQVEISFVLSDKKEAQVLERARDLGVPTYLVERLADKAQHEQEILNKLREHQVDWIFLAGYMRLLSSSFLKEFSSWVGGSSQVVNIHPSLLPNYPGVDSTARAFRDKVPQSGVTIHLVDEGMDTGKILFQESLPVHESEDLATFEKRIHQLEHRLYTDFLQEVAQGHRLTQRFQIGSAGD